MKTPLYDYLEDLAQAPGLRFSSRCSALQSQHFEVGYFYKKATAVFGSSSPSSPPLQAAQTLQAYFQLYPPCQVVRGKPHTLLCHLNQGHWRPIPERLADVLELNQGQSIAATKAHFGGEWDAGIERYFQLLQQEGWGIFTEKPRPWGKLSAHWTHPSALLSSILEYDSASTYPALDALEQLLALGLQQLELWWKTNDIALVEKLLQRLRDSPLRQIQLYLPYRATAAPLAQRLLSQHTRLQRLVFFDAPSTQRFFEEHPALRGRAQSTQAPFPDAQTLEAPYFHCQSLAYAEAQEHLVGLHRLLSIDQAGRVKRFPSHTEVWGVFPRHSLLALWAEQPPLPGIAEIAPCRTCSYRYICQSKQAPYREDSKWRRPCSFPEQGF